MELLKTQTCPYCGDEVEDCYAEWEEGNHNVTCDSCHKDYVVEPEYKFLGFKIHKVCDKCDDIMEYEPCLCKED